ncbi:MCE family protein [Streptomyces sp. LP05-1]|uniref:MCE family protein n=1 Tax=Streptomyces pyxinae TaxID=2970734 RepID=A0ABT2CEI1_9ACTN|nr:MCE family protein [Streptomyces sp. LP05-1]MCS0635730.1 MCE family protein [Streptomyces sp. LP05-1]
MKSPRPHLSHPLALLVLGLAAVLTASVLTAVRVLGDDTTRITAYFERTVGVHPGSDVRVLGVRVGGVTSVRPEAERVRVTLEVDRGVKIPRLVRAVVVAPSVVSGRFVQLAPAYSGSGPTAGDGGVIPVSRTSTPLEVDELARSLTQLSDALGPRGANKDGALSGLVTTGAKNLKGNGADLGTTIQQLGGASKVLGDSGGDLARTVRQLASVVSVLKDNDSTVRTVERQLADVTGFLAGEKADLAAALRELGSALSTVSGFLRENRGRLAKDVTKLATLTQSLVDQRVSLAEALDTLPLAAGNVENAYNPATRTIDGRANLREVSALPLPAAETFGPPPTGRRP